MPKTRLPREPPSTRFLDPIDHASVLRDPETGNLLDLPSHAIPHAQRAVTKKMHHREERTLKRNPFESALWEEERDQWLDQEGEGEGEHSSAPSTLADFLPAMQLSPAERGLAFLRETQGHDWFGVMSHAASVEWLLASLSAHGLTLEEYTAFCLALVSRESGFAGSGEDEAAGLLDGALRLLSALQDPCDDLANGGPAAMPAESASASPSAPAAGELQPSLGHCHWPLPLGV